MEFNFLNKEALIPGTVVFVQFGSNGGYFAITCPEDYWKEKATEKEINLFLCGRVPLFLMGDDFEWSFRVVDKSVVTPLFDLFVPIEVFNHYFAFFKSFTCRDGSRYYKEFLEEICTLRKISFETGESYPLDDGIVFPLQRKQSDFLKVLVSYRKQQENKNHELLTI